MGNSSKETNEILNTLNVQTIEELMDQTVPASIRIKRGEAFKHKGKELMGIHSETMMLQHLREYAMSNKVFKSYQGKPSLFLFFLLII